MVRISIIISLVLLACFVSGRKIFDQHFPFSIFISGNYQEESETALSDEALLGRVERDAGKKKGAGKRKKNKGRKRKTKGKTEGKKSGEKKKGKKMRGNKGRKAQRECGRQTGLEYSQIFSNIFFQ